MVETKPQFQTLSIALPDILSLQVTQAQFELRNFTFSSYLDAKFQGDFVYIRTALEIVGYRAS